MKDFITEFDFQNGTIGRTVNDELDDNGKIITSEIQQWLLPSIEERALTGKIKLELKDDNLVASTLGLSVVNDIFLRRKLSEKYNISYVAFNLP